MKIQLTSEDHKVHELCREVLGDVAGRGWTLHADKEISNKNTADLYVWDAETPENELPAVKPSERWRHYFLVERDNAEELRGRLRLSDANIILKPVTKATLTAFLADACKRCSEVPASAEVALLRSLRADRDDILQCLMQTNLKLQEYAHDRTNFLARAIHDFRAPLTAITGYCGLLLNDDVGSLTTQQREVIERMHRSAKKLSQMASAMFQLSIAPRIEIALDLERCDLNDCIKQALSEVQCTIDEKRISVDVDLAPCPAPLLFERAKIEQVVVNLLDNACRFTPRSGTIRIKGYPFFWQRRITHRGEAGASRDRRMRDERTPNAYRVDIQDSGPGIPAVHLTKIFEEYTSYAGGVDRSGGGLGLAICRMIAHQHRGLIWAESSRDGAVFSFMLPLDREELAPNERGGTRTHPALI